MTLIEKVLNIEVSHAERLQADLPKTLERKPDQLLKITNIAFKSTMQWLGKDNPRREGNLLLPAVAGFPM